MPKTIKTELENIIQKSKLANLSYTNKANGKECVPKDFGYYSSPLVFMRDIHEGILALNDADTVQSKFTTDMLKLHNSDQ